MKRKIRLKEGIIGFPPGDYEMNVVMSEALVQRGKAVYIDKEVKQEKKMIETKEEKFTPINKRKRKKK